MEQIDIKSRGHLAPFNDLATLTGRPRRHSAGGRTYRLFPQTMGTLGRLQEWLDGQNRDPDDVACANLGGLSDGARGYLLGEGCWRVERRRVLLGTQEADDLLFTVAGMTELLYLSVRRGDRRFTRAVAAALYWRLDGAGHRKAVWTIWGQRGMPNYQAHLDEPAPVDWWGVFHKLMADPFGFPPDRVARMTWPQVLCALGDGKAPQSGIDLAKFPGGRAGLVKRRKDDPWFP